MSSIVALGLRIVTIPGLYDVEGILGGREQRVFGFVDGCCGSRKHPEALRWSVKAKDT
jgi:hypothetical protein